MSITSHITRRHKMRYLGLIFFCFISFTHAQAHPVDLPCPQGGEACQEPAAHLGLNNPDFFECHRQYWHHRREVNETIRQYSECIGAVNAHHYMRGWPPVAPQETVLNYWDVIPAHPVVDQAANLPYCQAQLDSAIFTDWLFSGWTEACKAYLWHLRGN